MAVVADFFQCDVQILQVGAQLLAAVTYRVAAGTLAVALWSASTGLPGQQCAAQRILTGPGCGLVAVFYPSQDNFW